MHHPAGSPYLQPLAQTDEQLAKHTILLCSLGLERQLKGMSTANKNRVLLALHAQIGEQLDSLAANNDQ